MVEKHSTRRHTVERRGKKTNPSGHDTNCSELTKLEKRYLLALRAIPPSGGNGCHQAMFGVAIRGLKAGRTSEGLFQDIRETVSGDRYVSDHEIHETIKNAIELTKGSKIATSPPRCSVSNYSGAFERIAADGAGATLESLVESSPVYPGDVNTEEFLVRLFGEDDLLFIGDRRQGGIPGKTIRPVTDWITERPSGPYIIPNPLSGFYGLTRSGTKETLRGDSCIDRFDHSVVEFDTVSRERQYAFFQGLNFETTPVVAIIDSGKKSLHAWIRISGVQHEGEHLLGEIETLEQWDRIVVPWYLQCLAPLGVDRACRNPSRLSRLPNVTRPETGNLQRLLYLDPEAGQRGISWPI